MLKERINTSEDKFYRDPEAAISMWIFKLEVRLKDISQMKLCYTNHKHSALIISDLRAEVFGPSLTVSTPGKQWFFTTTIHIINCKHHGHSIFLLEMEERWKWEHLAQPYFRIPKI